MILPPVFIQTYQYNQLSLESLFALLLLDLLLNVGGGGLDELGEGDLAVSGGVDGGDEFVGVLVTELLSSLLGHQLLQVLLGDEARAVRVHGDEGVAQTQDAVVRAHDRKDNETILLRNCILHRKSKIYI